MTHSTSVVMGSFVSTQLCQMSSNLQRIPQQAFSLQHGSLDRPATKRRRLELTTNSPTKDSSWHNTVTQASHVPVSIPMTLADASNQFTEVHRGKDPLFEPRTQPTLHGPFRREIKIDLLELRNNVKEFDEIYSLSDADFPTRCSLQIYVAKHEDTQNGVRVKCGEDLWSDQQIGTIRTLCGNDGHSTTKILLPKPFIIPEEELLVKGPVAAIENAGQGHQLDLADQCFVKVWLEALRPWTKWPPLELQSRVEEGGKMQNWLQDGTFANSDMRILCKGELLLDGRASNFVDVFLKLGGLQVQTSCTLHVEVQYALPYRNSRPGVTNFQKVETSDDFGVPNYTNSSSITDKTRQLSISEAQDTNVEECEPVERSFRKSPTLPPLIVPHSKARMCHPITKNLLVSGEELDAIDDDFEMSWRTAKHVATIENHVDLNFDTRDYILKWNSFVLPMRLSSSCYLPRALFAFLKENKDWFAERRTRVTEFSLHATSLRLRGIIDIQCFSKCVNLLRNCIATHKELAENFRESARRISYGATDAENSMDRNLIEEVTSDERVLEFRKASGGPAVTNLQLDITADVEPLLEDVKDVGIAVEEQMDHEMLDEDDIGHNKSDEDAILGDAELRNYTCETQTLAAGKDIDNDDPDREELYEDASEEIEVIERHDYFDAEEEESTLEQPYYFHSYWQGISQRWPRIKLHHPENFRKACVIAAIAIFQGFPNDNIDRLIALHIHHCPNESIQDLVHMYYHAEDVAPELPGVCMTERKLHIIMWEAGRDLCESWLTDVYRADDGARRTVREAVDIAANIRAWDALWDCVSNECSGL